MREVLTEDEVRRFRAARDIGYSGDEDAVVLAISHEELRARLERAEGALKEAEQEARIWTGAHVNCGICAAYAERPFGQVTVDIPHRPTCPFWMLTVAALGAAGERGRDDG